MKQPNFASPAERNAYQKGFNAGYNEGMRKAMLALRLLTYNTENFVDEILQNSPEAKELRKLFTE